MEEFNKARMRRDYLVEVGKVIRENRNKKNISQEKLALYLEVDRSTISKYESGSTDMPVSNLPLISYYCNFSMSEFIRTKDAERVINVLDESIRYGYPKPCKDVVQFPTTQSEPKKGSAYTREEVTEYLMLEENEVKREALNTIADILPLAQKDHSGRISRILKATVDFVLYDEDAAKCKKLQGYLKNVSEDI